jgi:hypothetical protein
MNCYLCDDRGREVPAVAVCHSCGIALCRSHLDRDLLAVRAQGVTRRECTHDPILAARRRQQSQARPASTPE